MRKWMFGENYRAEWKEDLEVPVFDISTQFGGLDIIKKGGGHQTISLRVADSTGFEYTLRSVEKYPEKAVPEVFRETFAEDLVQDQISAAHPYSALVVPYLAQAAGIYHTNPSLVYVPDDPNLGVYKNEIGNTLVLFEERPEEAARVNPSFGNAKKIISTEKVLENLEKDNDNKVDQDLVVRSRLFDLLIGDWDRHDDQWRWGVFEKDKGEVYQPIPRDRDQAFFVSDGWFPNLMTSKSALPMLEGFHEKVKWVPGFMFGGVWFDRSFMNELMAEDWLKQAKEVQAALTDKVIEDAIAKFPSSIYSLNGTEIIHKLKARRDKLSDYAMDYYKFMAQEVDVPGSDKREWFRMDYKKDGKAELSVFKIKEGKPSKKIFERTFSEKETKEIRLFGRGGRDVFEFEGERSSVKLRVIGGNGKDSVIQNSLNKVHLYDDPSGVKMNKSKGIRDHTSIDPSINLYDRKSYKYPKFTPLVYLNYNADDGIILGGGFMSTTHGFRKTPYKNHHFLLAHYAIRTGSYNFRYDGRFNQVFGKWGIKIDADVKSPNYVNNFFGWGNETEFIGDIEFYQTNIREILFQGSFTHPVGKHGYIEFGPAFQRGVIESPDSDSTFIYLYAETLAEPLFDISKYFAGLQWTWGIDNTDRPIYPTRGLRFIQKSVVMGGLNSGARNFASHNASISFYQSFRLPARLTFSFRIGGGINQGNYELYQAQILDGKTELRGYRKTRFYGDSRFFSNNEIRLRLGKFRSYLFPASYGINGFFDMGRVWYKDDNGLDPSSPTGTSSIWHSGFGGGLWFTPFKLTILSAELAHSKEGNMFYLRLDFLF
jgi:hypothetical protein